jgi:hypothetical protein
MLWFSKLEIVYFTKRFWRRMFLIVIFSVPGVASGQSICEGLNDILTSSKEELEFQEVPGAICRQGITLGKNIDYRCIWQKPGPPPGAKGRAWRQWVNTTIMPSIKKLSAAIQQCIKKEAIPFSWRKFRKDRTSGGFTKGYFVQRAHGAERRLTIGICFEFDDDEVGAGVVLAIHSAPSGDSYCRW